MLKKPESVVRDSIKQRKLKMRKFFISKLSRFQRIATQSPNSQKRKLKIEARRKNSLIFFFKKTINPLL